MIPHESASQHTGNIPYNILKLGCYTDSSATMTSSGLKKLGFVARNHACGRNLPQKSFLSKALLGVGWVSWAIGAAKSVQKKLCV